MFKEDKYNGAEIFNGFTVDNDGYVVLNVANPSATRDDQINAALNSVDPVIMKLTFDFNNGGNRVLNDNGTPIAKHHVWIRLTNGDTSQGYDGYVLLKKDNGAFRKCKQLKKVNLDTSKKIRKINEKAFYDCKKLATVKLDGRNLKKIGSKAFSGTKSNITFKVKANTKTQYNKAVKMLKKAAPKKAKFSKI